MWTYLYKDLYNFSTLYLKSWPDQKLVQAFVEFGNKKAFAEIYSRYVDAVYRYIFSRVGDRSFAEDITSETFMSLYAVLKSYRGGSKLSSFIIGVAVNKIKQQVAKSYKHKHRDFEEYLVIDDESEPYEELEIEDTYSKELVDRILSKLSEKYRKVLIERFINASSVEDTAIKLGLTKENVRVIQFRALKKASNILDKSKKDEPK